MHINNENVIIYDNYERSQVVSHILSSNENPTIENVEALLVKLKIYIQLTPIHLDSSPI